MLTAVVASQSIESEIRKEAVHQAAAAAYLCALAKAYIVLEYHSLSVCDYYGTSSLRVTACFIHSVSGLARQLPFP